MKRRSEWKNPDRGPLTFEEKVLARIRNREKARKTRTFLLISIILILTSFYLLIQRWEEHAYRNKTFQITAETTTGQQEIPLIDQYYFPTRKENSNYLLYTVSQEEAPRQL